MRVLLAQQVVDFVRRLPPEPRRRLRQALRELAHGKGDIKQVEGPLSDYCRLRVGSCRAVFAYAGARTIHCLFAERRSIVCEVFANALRRHLAGEE